MPSISPNKSLNDSKAGVGGANKLLQLPVARVKTIMKSSPDLGNVSSEAYFLITKATECFVQYLAQEAHKNSKDCDEVEYKHLCESCIFFKLEMVFGINFRILL